MKPLPWILLFQFLLIHVLSAQNEGKVIFYTAPPLGRTIIKINDDILIKSAKDRLVSLPAGVHRVQLWASNYEYKDTIVTVIADSTIKYKKLLYYTEEFKTQKNAIQAYERTKFYYKIPDYGAIVFATGGLGFFGSTLNYKSRYNKINERYQESVSRSEIVDLKQELSDLKQQVIRRRNISYALFGTAALLKLWGHFSNKKFKKRYPEKPTFKRAVPPFDLSLTSEEGSNNLSFKIKF